MGSKRTEAIIIGPYERSDMKRKLEEIIVLYDTHDKGKTSTLRELINVMAGSVPTKGGDIRVIIRNYHAKGQHKKVNVFVATCGDSPCIIEDNIRFFNGKMPDACNVSTYICNYGSEEWEIVENEEQIKGIESNICISACRTDGGGVDAMHYFVNSNLSYTFFTAWIRLKYLRLKLNVNVTKTKTPNWNKLATELKSLIDAKFARNIIQ